MFKKALVFMIILAVFLSGCATGGTNPSASPTADAEISPPDKANTVNEEHQASQNKIEERIIYDQDNIVVTLKGVDIDGLETRIKLLIENNQDKPISMQIRDCSVNGFMVEPSFHVDVEPGKKANDYITINDFDLGLLAVETIGNIEFKLYIFDIEDWEVEGTYSDPIVINIEDIQQPEPNFERTVYDDNNIKISYIGYREPSDYDDLDIVFYIENNSDIAIEVQARDTSLNGYMIDPTMSSRVLPNKKRVDRLTFHSFQLEDNDITQLDNAEFILHIFDSDDWGETSIYTEKITINF